MPRLCARCRQQLPLTTLLRSTCEPCRARVDEATRLESVLATVGRRAVCDELIKVATAAIHRAPWHSTRGDDLKPVLESLVAAGLMNEASTLANENPSWGPQSLKRFVALRMRAEHPSEWSDLFAQRYPIGSVVDQTAFSRLNIDDALVTLVHLGMLHESLVDIDSTAAWAGKKAAALGLPDGVVDKMPAFVRQNWLSSGEFVTQACRNLGRSGAPLQRVEALYTSSEWTAREPHVRAFYNAVVLLAAARLDAVNESLVSRDLSFHTPEVSALLGVRHLREGRALQAFDIALGYLGLVNSSSLLRLVPYVLTEDESLVDLYFYLTSNSRLPDFYLACPA